MDAPTILNAIVNMARTQMESQSETGFFLLSPSRWIGWTSKEKMKNKKQNRIEKGLYWDRALSLVEGCDPISEGCDNCWSTTQTHMRSRQANQKMIDRYAGLVNTFGGFNGRIRLMWDDIKKPKSVKKPTTWAVWNDLFHKDVPLKFQFKFFDMALKTPWHTYIVCTKRAAKMKNRVDRIYALLEHSYPEHTIPLPNVILMVTGENQEMVDSRVPFLFKTQAAVRGVSIEPMLGPVDLSHYFSNFFIDDNDDEYATYKPGLDWVIIGEESGPKARKIEKRYIFDLLTQCIDDDPDNDVPVFLKQMWVNGKLKKMPVFAGRKWDQLPNLK